MKHESYEGHSLLSIIRIWNRVSSPYRKLNLCHHCHVEQYTHTVQPYAYGTEKHTIRVRYVPYAYGMKYAYGTQHIQDL